MQVPLENKNSLEEIRTTMYNEAEIDRKET
jgi:hypothetical protein